MHDLIYLEREGAIYRGYRPDSPIEFWDESIQTWQPYTPDRPLPADWARELPVEEALTLMKNDELTKNAPPLEA